MPIFMGSASYFVGLADHFTACGRDANIFSLLLRSFPRYARRDEPLRLGSPGNIGLSSTRTSNLQSQGCAIGATA
jgi:hypothetical protein